MASIATAPKDGREITLGESRSARSLWIGVRP